MIHKGKEKLFESINDLIVADKEECLSSLSCRSSITCNAEKSVSMFVTIRLTVNLDH